jgi:predicted transcriptional regulator
LSAPIFDEIDEDAEATAIANARAEIAAGKGVSHEAAIAWLKSWGTPSELPRPKSMIEDAP